MHIPDGYLGPATYVSAWAVMVPTWRHAARKVRETVRTSEIPYLAMGTVFSFVAMMFMLPLPGGTTGHISGTALVAILLGPWAAVIAVSTALIIQAVVMGDGGITAIGANCFNIAVVGALTGWGVYTLIVACARWVNRPSSPTDEKPPSLSLRLVAAAVASYLAINLGALMAAIELGSQPGLYAGEHGGAAYFPFPMKVAIPAIMIPHLTTVGVIEAAVTVMMLTFLHRAEVSMSGLTRAGLVAIAGLSCAPAALAHSIHYDVQEKAMAVRVYSSEKDAASYSQYELYGPGDKEPHQTGRTDKNGFVGFVPDRPGTWKLRVLGESAHGFHGITTEIEVNQALGLQSFSKPLVATYTKLVTGVSIALGLFGIYALWASRAGASKEENKRA